MAAGATTHPQMLQQLQNSPRRLGRIVDPPKAIYFIYLPLLLSAAGLAAWVFPTDLMLFIISLIGGAVGAYSLWDLLINLGPFRVTNLMGTMLLVGYGIGAVNSWLTIDRAGLSLGEAMNRDPAILSRGIAVVVVSAALLYCVGELLEKPVLGKEFRAEIDSRSYVLIILCTGAIIYAYLTGQLGYGGVQIAANHRASTIESFVSWIATPLFAYTVCVAFNARGRLQRIATTLCAFLQIMLLIPVGRRVLAFSIFTGIFALRMGQRRFYLKFSRQIILAALLMGLISFTSIVFYYIRSANPTNGQSASFMERLQLAMELRETRNSSEVMTVLQSNVEQRTFILRYLSDLLDATRNQRPLMGSGLILQVERVVPSSLWSGKDQVLGVVEETLVDQYFNFSFLDEANSVLTAGALDFGILGALIYPLILCLLLRVYLEFIGNLVPGFVAPFVVLATIGSLFQIENELAAYFITIRDGFLFAMAFWGISLIPKFQLRRT